MQSGKFQPLAVRPDTAFVSHSKFSTEDVEVYVELSGSDTESGKNLMSEIGKVINEWGPKLFPSKNEPKPCLGCGEGKQ